MVERNPAGRPTSTAAVVGATPPIQTPQVLPPSSRLVRRLLPLVSLPLAAIAAGCDRLKEEFLGVSAADARYEADTLLLRGQPPILFRVVPAGSDGARVFPIAAGTRDGVQMLRFSDRAWREFDRDVLRSGKTLPLVHQGRTAGELRIVRGMWDPPSRPLDDFPGCPIVIPGGIGLYQGTAEHEVGVLRPVAPVPGEVERANTAQALANIATLVAPTKGIKVHELAGYRRQVVTVPNRETGHEAVVAIYEDEAPRTDTTSRPVQFLVILDKSPYGYRPSFIFATRGAATDQPPWRLLDWVDLTGDGTPELVFGLALRDAVLSTVVVGYARGEWRELMRRGEGRCDF